jgi:hypothetical protein
VDGANTRSVRATRARPAARRRGPRREAPPHGA